MRISFLLIRITYLPTLIFIGIIFGSIILVTSISQKNRYDFESRYFWPWSGTNEDPVTGGTHTFLTKYWSTRLNKKKMNSYQCSERTGFMEVELIEDNKLTIKSEAQIVLKGELRL